MADKHKRCCANCVNLKKCNTAENYPNVSLNEAICLDDKFQWKIKPKEGMLAPNGDRWTEHQITEVLKLRHPKDFFVSQCKTTEDEGFGIMDGYAVTNRSNKNRYVCYEIKTNYYDFLNDVKADKWRKYMPYCDALYFVCPHKMIAKEQIPDGAGLIYVSIKGDTTKIIKWSVKELADRRMVFDTLAYLIRRRAYAK